MDGVDLAADLVADALQGHAFFADMPPWSEMHLQPPPFVPQLKSVDDTAYFDPSEHLLRSFSDAPEGDGRREAWLAVDRFSSAFVTSWPSERDEMSSEEFREVLAWAVEYETEISNELAQDSHPDVDDILCL